MKFMKSMLVIGVAAFALAAATTARAQERQHAFSFVNTGIGTAYYSIGGTNVLVNGNLVYQGGTNTVSMTNGAIYAAATAVPVPGAPLQNVPVTLELAVSLPSGGTNGSASTAQLSVSPDGVYWLSNQVTLAISPIAGITNVATVTIPLINGTNVFTDMAWVRWDYYSGAQVTGGSGIGQTVQALKAFVYR
jgi:hypothetical protein